MAEQKSNDKVWSWYSKDHKRLCQLITPRERVIENLVKKELLNDGLLKGMDKALKWTSENIKYDAEWGPNVLSPVETLASRSGVCLEYANLALTLINACMNWGHGQLNPNTTIFRLDQYSSTIMNRKDFYVIIGKSKEKHSIYHAFIGIIPSVSGYKVCICALLH